MKHLALAFCASLLATGAAFADAKVSEADGKKIQDAIAAWGCSGGEMEKEDEGSGVYEVDDATCKTGQFDIKLDGDMQVRSISRD
jgi:hypothetical protein